MFGIFSSIGVGLFVIGSVVGVIGLMIENRPLGWTLVVISITLLYIVL